MDVGKAVAEFKAGRDRVPHRQGGQHPRAGRQGLVLARRTWSANVRAVDRELFTAKPASAKGRYLLSAHVSARPWARASGSTRRWPARSRSSVADRLSRDVAALLEEALR